ncbi:hypothetical protein MSAN_01883500 [Mycena sanguinolenta]|uniref:F-box domain-containing protein n=1 Tax=Mycena sanguinolenta TaxID=230812 RepID=A0A8H7CQK1_9AGAR|nr:hypothetical protein MSAN_01883500 [Mycena sanguinolenta]
MVNSTDSPFSHHFNTNYAPSNEEIQIIQKDLVSRAQELAQIDARISELSAQRDKIQAYIDSHKALVSHPRRLPPDIVREIFVACLPTTRNAVMSAQEAPLLLCRICSAWRTIALSSPRLWASIHVPFDYVLRNEARMPAVAQWLQRSGACPLSLSVVFEDLQWADGSSSGSALLASLADFSARWWHVEFMELSPARTRELARIRPPALESLKLTGHVGGSLLAALELVKVSTLRAVALHSRSAEHLDDIVLAMPLLWDQLTHLTFQCNGDHRGFLFENVLVVLERCTRLISFQVTLRSSIDSSSESMSLPSLEILILEGTMQTRSLSHLVERVSMPQLRQFRFPTLGGHRRFSLADLGTRSPLIAYLDNISLSSFSDQSLLEALRSLPSLRKLVVLDGDSRTTQLLTLLTPKPNVNAILCPTLQELVIIYCSSLEETTLDAFIRGRIELGFRRLEFKNSMDSDMLSKDQIQSILSQGLDISIVQDNTWTEPTTPWLGLPDS